MQFRVARREFLECYHARRLLICLRRTVLKNSSKRQRGCALRDTSNPAQSDRLRITKKNDLLLSYTLGTLDDGNGVGAVGKGITQAVSPRTLPITGIDDLLTGLLG